MTKEQKAEKSIQDEYRRTFDALQTAVCGRTLDQRTLMLIRHMTGKRMTEDKLRAILQKEMEDEGYGPDREAGSDRPESCDQGDTETD